MKTLSGSGFEVCFANPDTSEMHFVNALDQATGIQPVLCLCKGVATGVVDGYARIAGKPAATLLHLGPDLANLHNARKAQRSQHHRRSRPAPPTVRDPLTSDVQAISLLGCCGWHHLP
ncbi:thiamine pyrophosphate-binding protein [Streptomyces spiralis]|uniref:thiamine pyrophosphate-binding protein n=1 Tax=Streptomyces spiralis TaxID=66376 RepID=UPI003690687D